MDSLKPRITNNSSRPEIDHSKSTDNVPLKLNIDSYSEPIDYHRTVNKPPIQPTNNPTTHTNHNQKTRLEISFNDFVESHRQFSFEDANNNNTNIQPNSSRKSHNEGFEPIDSSDDEYDRREDSPSSTPIVSDLEELLADTPNMQRISVETPNDIPISDPSFPQHGISIPYIMDSDNDESDTPEPCDTPITDDIININGLNAQCPYGTVEEMHFSDSDSDIDYDQFITDDIGDVPQCSAALSPKSRSWQKITMTKMNYKKCKRIKCITPITQEMAEWKLTNMNTRRRSVANITPSVHKLFKLDDDLLKIREEYLARTNGYENKSENDNNNTNDNISSDKSDQSDQSSEQLNESYQNDKTKLKPMPIQIPK